MSRVQKTILARRCVEHVFRRLQMNGQHDVAEDLQCRLERLEPRLLLSTCLGNEIGDHDTFIRPHLIDDVSYLLEAETCEFSTPPAAVEGPPAGAPIMAPLLSQPILHSRPSASAKIHLDFDGHVDANWGKHQPGETESYDIDNNPSGFSTAELARIEQIWAQVAEDYAPFDVDVTTEDPGALENGRAVKVVIGGNGDWFEDDAGGVSFIGSFSNATPNEVYVFADRLNDGRAKTVAEASSHETGHAFGLLHKSIWNDQTKIDEFNSGTREWAPIMGNSYEATFSTWHTGDSSICARCPQDDMMQIASSTNGFGFVPDEAGDSLASAAELGLDGTTIDQSGIIHLHTDMDMFRFDSDSDSITIHANAAATAPNLQIILELRDAADNLLTSSSSGTKVSINTSITPGTYYVVVQGTGTYGIVGQYSLGGSISSDDILAPGDTDADDDVDFADFSTLAANFTGTITPAGIGGKFRQHGDFDGDGDVDFLDFSTLAGNFTGTITAPADRSAENSPLEGLEPQPLLQAILTSSSTEDDGFRTNPVSPLALAKTLSTPIRQFERTKYRIVSSDRHSPLSSSSSSIGRSLTSETENEADDEHESFGSVPCCAAPLIHSLIPPL